MERVFDLLLGFAAGIAAVAFIWELRKEFPPKNVAQPFIVPPGCEGCAGRYETADAFGNLYACCNFGEDPLTPCAHEASAVGACGPKFTHRVVRVMAA